MPLCDEALRPARIPAESISQDAEVHGLVALMDVRDSRMHARIGANVEPVLLLDQDCGRAGDDYRRRANAATASRPEPNIQKAAGSGAAMVRTRYEPIHASK